MELSEEMIKRIFDLFGNDNKVRKLVAEGDINSLWSYVYVESSKYSIPFFYSSDIVQACENLNFRKLEDLYFQATYHLNKEPFNIEEQIGIYKYSYPNASENDITRFIERLKQDEAQKKIFLEEVVAAFKSLNLQGIYIKAKRAEAASSLCGDLARLRRSLLEQTVKDKGGSVEKKKI